MPSLAGPPPQLVSLWNSRWTKALRLAREPLRVVEQVGDVAGHLLGAVLHDQSHEVALALMGRGHLRAHVAEYLLRYAHVDGPAA